MIVLLLGFVITMVFFGVYRPAWVLGGLLSLFTGFIGVILYLVLALSDPFLGHTPIDSEPIRYVLSTMRADADGAF